MPPPIRTLTKFKSAIHDWLPPAIRRWGNRLLGASIVYRGPFSDWATASAATKGYGQHDILQRVSRATRMVLDGSATFEQDGIAFHTIPPPSQALSGILLAAALDGGRLSVLDFGGGLASHYLRWRSLLSALPDMHWAVVEQVSYVAEGRRLFQSIPTLSFHEDIAAVAISPNVVLASSALQYLPEPYLIFQKIIELAPRVIILDRQPCGESDMVMAQSVPSYLGRASYPLWILSREKIFAQLSKNYQLLCEFETSDNPVKFSGGHVFYQGAIWLRHT